MRKSQLVFSLVCMAGSSVLAASSFGGESTLPLSAPRPREASVPTSSPVTTETLSTPKTLGTPAGAEVLDATPAARTNENRGTGTSRVASDSQSIAPRSPANTSYQYEESPAFSAPPPRPMPPTQADSNARPSPRVTTTGERRVPDPNVRRRAFDSQTYLQQREMMRARARTARIEARARQGISLSRPDGGAGPSSADLNEGAYYYVP